MHDKTPYVGNKQVTVANCQNLSISGIYSIIYSISEVFFVQHLSNLIYAGKLVDNGYSVILSSNGCVI